MSQELNYNIVFGKPKYLCRWWMKVREIKDKPTTMIDSNGKIWQLPLHEFYCPLWAKPLDFIHSLIFGKPTLKNI